MKFNFPSTSSFANATFLKDIVGKHVIEVIDFVKEF